MVTEFVETSTETRCEVRAFKAAHRSVSPFDPAMILLDPTVEILVRPVLHSFVQFSLDRLRVAIVSIRRNPRRNDTGHHFG